MPRDLIETETKPDLSKPTLKGLAWLLRHRDEWPADHVWDFDIALEHQHPCGTIGCAVGIADLRWRPEPQSYFELLGISVAVHKQIFEAGMESLASPKITPEVVAGRIDDHLAGRPIRFLEAGDRG